MKKLYIIALMMLVSLPGLSQARRDFFNFASTFNWSMSEADFKTKYSNRIVSETDSLALSLELQKGTYLLTDMKIEDYDCLTLVSYSLEETPSIVACLTSEALQASVPALLSTKLDRIVDQNMQEPDLSMDDMPLSAFGFSGMDDVKGRLRIWMMDTLTFGTVSMATEDGLIYLFVARKGEPNSHNIWKAKKIIREYPR